VGFPLHTRRRRAKRRDMVYLPRNKQEREIPKTSHLTGLPRARKESMMQMMRRSSMVKTPYPGYKTVTRKMEPGKASKTYGRKSKETHQGRTPRRRIASK